MYPTVADVLALPVLQRGGPTVVAGANGLQERVRWVHVAEIADIAHLLRGGELVLTTGVALPDDNATLTQYLDELAEVGVAGVIVELVQHWNKRLPTALVRAANRHGIPLVTLSRETRYVAISESVNGLIVDAQVAELRAAEQVHQTFTALTVSGAEPTAVLREVARMTGAPAVLETLAHEVLAYDAAGDDPAELLDEWGRRSRAVQLDRRTDYHAKAGWLVTIVGARGHDWGRLVVVCATPPPHQHVVVAERAASALAMHRLVARESDSIERQTHRDILAQVLASPVPSSELLARAAAFAVPLADRRLVGAAVRPSIAEATHPVPAASTDVVLRELAEAIALAARRARVPALVAVLEDGSVRALLSLSQQASDEAVLRRLATEIRQTRGAPPLVVGAGTTVHGTSQARRSLVEAAHVAAAALHRPAHREVHRLGDVRIRGLLRLLAEDDRVEAFADRELGPLLARDRASGSRLVDALRYFCAHGGNKSAAAAAAHISRTAYYQQLAKIEQILGVSLEDPESVLSLHVALLAHDVRTGADRG